MRQLLLLLVLALPGWGAITAAISHQAAHDNPTITTNIAVNAGDVVVVMTAAAGSGVSFTFGTPTLDSADMSAPITKVNADGHEATAMACGIAASTGTSTVSMTLSYTGYGPHITQIVYAVPGYTCTADGTDSNVSAYEDTAMEGYATTGIATSNANDIIIMAASPGDSTATYTAGAGYTIPTNGSYTVGDLSSLATQYQEVTATGTYAPTVAVSGAVAYTAVSMALEKAEAGGSRRMVIVVTQ
jgi:hypothetical protein